MGIKMGVQPPKRAQVGTQLYPPVVAKQLARDSEPGVDYFATAVALDGSGAVVDGCLDGTKAVSRFELAGSKPGSASFVFPFADLSMAHAGTYVVRVDVYKFQAGDYAGATLVDQVETRAVSVSKGRVASESPSSDEAALMRKARDAGVGV